MPCSWGDANPAGRELSGTRTFALVPIEPGYLLPLLQANEDEGNRILPRAPEVELDRAPHRGVPLQLSSSFRRAKAFFRPTVLHLAILSVILNSSTSRPARSWRQDPVAGLASSRHPQHQQRMAAQVSLPSPSGGPAPGRLETQLLGQVACGRARGKQMITLAMSPAAGLLFQHPFDGPGMSFS